VALRVVFCGTPAFALPSLRRLVAEQDFKIEAVITQPDRPRGRGQERASSPVKEEALEAGLHVYQPEKMKSDSAIEFFRRLVPDVVVIIAYGQIIPVQLLDVPRLGWINLHASLLPRYRGAAPIQRAILAGETRTGLTTMRIDAGLDTGPTLMRQEIDIGPDETAPELARRMAEAGAPLVVDTLRKLNRGEIVPVPQEHTQATLAPPLKKEEGQIEWSRPAQQIYNRIRGLEPWPGAFTRFRGQLCQIRGRPATAPPEISGGAPGTITVSGGKLFVACGEETFLCAETLQLEGRKRVSAREFANGARLSAGDRFGG
jgi:methionyl-tRNA formyltransferase